MEKKKYSLKQNRPKEYDWGLSYPVNTAKETRGFYNSFYKVIRKPVKVFEYHKKSCENHLILKGKGTMRVGNETVKISEGMSIVIPPNTPHGLIVPKKTLEVYVIVTPSITKEDFFTAVREFD